jgi:PIN domain nuclease of toxin-antitoxin system
LIVLDTHAWIWLASDPKRLSRRAANEIQRAKRIAISAISLWETAMLVRKGRIELDRGLLEWVEGALDSTKAEILPLTPAVAAVGSELELHGDPGDRIIAATALLAAATLVTKDEHLRRYDALKTVW